MPKHKYALGDIVQVGATEGTVIGRGEYAGHVAAELTYYLDFVHPQTGLPTRDWFAESQVRSA